MRHLNWIIFDEYCNPVSTTPAYSSADHYVRMGQFDQLAFHFLIDNQNAAGAATMSAFIEHSTDGRNWIIKPGSSLALYDTSGNTPPASINGSPNAVQLFASDPGSVPNLALVRLKFYFGGAGFSAAHVKVHVTARDEK